LINERLQFLSAVFRSEKREWFADTHYSYVETVFDFFDNIVNFLVSKVLFVENATESIAAFDGIVSNIEVIVFESELFDDGNGLGFGI